MISIADQLGESARGYQEPFALCGSHGYPVGRPYVYAPARFGRTSGSAALRMRRGRAQAFYDRGGSCWSAHVLPSGSLKVTNEPHG
jgi:hypothetical protein